MSIYNIDYFCSSGQVHNIELDDPSLNGSGSSSLQNEYNLPSSEIEDLFLSKYQLEYITKYVGDRSVSFRIVSHPEKSNTCYEKAQLIDSCDPLNIIKALYFECPLDQQLYVIVVPETGCFIDRSSIASLFGLPQDVVLAKAKMLPMNMSYGTCSPFITRDDLIENGGKIAKIIFDSETLVSKKHENSLDDFSFGLDHRFSLQMNYYHCYKMLKATFGSLVSSDDVLTLSFKEKFIRKGGKIKINYEFKSLNYRTAKFINSIHGVGDVSVENDCIDELDLPEILTSN